MKGSVLDSIQVQLRDNDSLGVREYVKLGLFLCIMFASMGLVETARKWFKRVSNQTRYNDDSLEAQSIAMDELSDRISGNEQFVEDFQRSEAGSKILENIENSLDK
jgi:hypothetical protein